MNLSNDEQFCITMGTLFWPLASVIFVIILLFQLGDKATDNLANRLRKTS